MSGLGDEARMRARERHIAELVTQAANRVLTEHPGVRFDAAILRAAGWDAAESTLQVVVMSALAFAAERFDDFQLAMVETADTRTETDPEPDQVVREMFMRMTRAQLMAVYAALEVPGGS